MRHQIVSEGALLGDLAHEHRDRAAHCLVDINYEHLIVISEKDRAPSTCRQNRPHLHFDHRFVHKETLSAGKGKTSGARRSSQMKILSVRACMLDVLNHCAFCGIHELRDLAK